MARLPAALIGPASSTGSPMTFMMRPNVPSPIGTAIACPVSKTSLPRTRPSVESMATVRTVDSPRCCATSSTSRLPLLSVSSAFRISGSGPSKCTSTTAPITCATRPILLLLVCTGAFIASPFDSKRFRTGDDLDQFLRNHGLAGAVVLEGQAVDDFAGVTSGGIHRAHARALFGRGIFQKRAEYLNGNVAGQQLGQNLRFTRFVFVERTGVLCARGCRFNGCGNELLRDRLLRNYRLEFRIADRSNVELALIEQFQHPPANRERVREADALDMAHLNRIDDVLTVQAAQLVAPLPADAEDFDFAALTQQAIDK